MIHKKIAIGATGALVAAVTGKVIAVYALALTVDGAGSIEFRSASTAISGDFPLGDKGGMVLPAASFPYLVTVAGEALNLAITGSTSVEGFLCYRLE